MRHHLFYFIYCVVQDDQLRLAIMDYLRRYHATDVETMALVAKHFSVYREWALHLEQSARARLQPLRAKTIPSDCHSSIIHTH